MYQRARKKAKALLSLHQPKPLPDGAEKRIRKIITEFEEKNR